MAGPALVVVVVGVVVVAPGLVPLAVPPDATGRSPVVVQDAADVRNSVGNPVVFFPPRCGVSDVVEETPGFSGGGLNFSSTSPILLISSFALSAARTPASSPRCLR